MLDALASGASARSDGCARLLNSLVCWNRRTQVPVFLGKIVFSTELVAWPSLSDFLTNVSELVYPRARLSSSMASGSVSK